MSADAIDAPLCSRPDLAKERLADWRASLGAGHPLGAEVDKPRVAALLAALADHSPYLWRLATNDPDRLCGCSCASPQPRSHNASIACNRIATPSTRRRDAMPVLRSAKAEVALLVALADLGGVWDLDRSSTP